MDLTMLENFMIIALHPSRGRFMIKPKFFRYGVAGAILIDLINSGKVGVNNNKLRILDAKLSADKISSTAMKAIKESGTERGIIRRIIKLSWKCRYFKKEVLKELERKRIIKSEARKFLYIIPYKKYFFREPGIRKELISGIRKRLLDGKYTFADKKIILAGLIKACWLTRVILSRKERKAVRKELKQIVKQNLVVRGVNATIRWMAILTSR